MSKRVSQDSSNTVDTNEQSIIMILDNISENQKKLMKSRSERYKDTQKILENSKT